MAFVRFCTQVVRKRSVGCWRSIHLDPYGQALLRYASDGQAVIGFNEFWAIRVMGGKLKETVWTWVDAVGSHTFSACLKDTPRITQIINRKAPNFMWVAQNPCCYSLSDFKSLRGFETLTGISAHPPGWHLRLSGLGKLPWRWQWLRNR